eukprot:CAMPEP_0115054940 /NCGR_PEP_ID=MMETSP0227-20121206/4372_1 /TAXON_ID=89957 /ORGANISM="Polarella glacialis, Strain CCMP 1383" /LENGTH=258 /DNA_ID=CAMNT_0002439469 /DNA_START=68 /DNA_END=844 /DNA_ORIENTATION=+
MATLHGSRAHALPTLLAIVAALVSVVTTFRSLVCFSPPLRPTLHLTPRTAPEPVQRSARVARGSNFGWHARDPTGVKHVETRKQAREASTLKSEMEELFSRAEVQVLRLGDDEMQRRLRIDDVIMSAGCRAAYVHMAAFGDRLEQRQAFVWLARNKGRVKTALAKRYARRGRIPNLYFVESKFDQWDEQFAKARKYPELNLPDPYQMNPNWVPKFMKGSVALRKFGKDDKQGKMWERSGLGDETKPFPPWGYPQDWKS